MFASDSALEWAMLFTSLSCAGVRSREGVSFYGFSNTEMVIRHDSLMNHEVAAYFNNILKFMQNLTNGRLLKENKPVF